MRVNTGAYLGSSHSILQRESSASENVYRTGVCTVTSTGDRPIQVGSHFHFFEVNPALEFDRAAAFGLHLNIPSSTAIRFEPGDVREIELVPYGGKRAIYGFNNLVDGSTADRLAGATKARALELATQLGFRSPSPQPATRRR